MQKFFKLFYFALYLAILKYFHFENPQSNLSGFGVTRTIIMAIPSPFWGTTLLDTSFYLILFKPTLFPVHHIFELASVALTGPVLCTYGLVALSKRVFGTSVCATVCAIREVQLLKDRGCIGGSYKCHHCMCWHFAPMAPSPSHQISWFLFPTWTMNMPIPLDPEIEIRLESRIIVVNPSF